MKIIKMIVLYYAQFGHVQILFFFFSMVIMCKLSFKVLTLHADVGFLNCYSLFRNLDFSWGFRSFILSLSKEVVSSHAPCTYLVYTLQADVFFSWCFHPLTLQPGFSFLLSMHIFGLHFPITHCFFFVCFFLEKIIFHTPTPQQGFSFSPCRCWTCKFLFSFFSISVFHKGFRSFIRVPTQVLKVFKRSLKGS